MILETFTEKEMIAEFNKEFMDAHDWTVQKYGTTWRRKVVKSKSFPIFSEPIVYQTKRNNKFIIQLCAESKKDVLENTNILKLCLIPYTNGYGVLTCVQKVEKSNKPGAFKSGQRHVFYIPHFFARYKKRTNSELTGIPLIIDFFKTNAEVNTKLVEKFNKSFDKDTAVATSSKGIQLGEYTQLGNIVYKTFLTPDMLYAQQADIYQKGEAGRETRNKSKISIESLDLDSYLERNPIPLSI